MNLFFKKQNNFIKSKNNGFTILEMMVAVALFTIIMTIGIGAILNTNLARKKAESQRVVMDNLSFIMEDISRNIRLGQTYHCGNNLPLDIPLDCIKNKSIAIEPFNGDTVNPNDQLIYQFVQIGNTNDAEILKSIDGGSTYLTLSPKKVVFDLNKSGFTVIGSEPSGISGSGDYRQPRVIIRLIGKMMVPELNIESSFNLQTTVSMRIIDK